jgi:hypothetical protein
MKMKFNKKFKILAMNKIMFIIFLFVFSIGILSLRAAKITAVKAGTKINVIIDGKYFTGYIFSSDEKYPFFYPVNGPLSGGSVTSMRNGEYPHHSSLFFGCDLVNGGNYWQEGLERGRIISFNPEILKEGGDTVVISDECIWSYQRQQEIYHHSTLGYCSADRCRDNAGDADGCTYQKNQPLAFQRPDSCRPFGQKRRNNG